MKRKEIIQLAVAVVILFVAGLIIYSQLAPKSSQSKADQYMVEKVRPIDPDYDEEALQVISDSNKVRDYYTAPDLKTGLGNSQPFSPVK